MAYGLELLNASARVQVNLSSLVPRLVASGYSPLISANYSEIFVTLPFAYSVEVPLLMVRPAQADKFVGAGSVGYFSLTTGNPVTTGFKLGGQCAFDWALFAYNGTAIADSSAYGIEVYGATSGSIIYSSKHAHPRITQIIIRAASTAANGNYPTTHSITGFTSMPWLVQSPYVVGPGYDEGVDGQGVVMAAVNATYNQITIDLRDGVFPSTRGYPQLPAYFKTAGAIPVFNPYYGDISYFPVGTFA